MLKRLVSTVPSKLVKNQLYEAEIISGAPLALTQRKVLIYQPAKSAMQSAHTVEYKLVFDSKQRWENELMGWSSSADPVQALNIKFKTKHDAILFCQRQGYDFEVKEPCKPRFKPKAYANNFKYSEKKLKYIHTK